jgi:hypothetical protein
VARPSLSAASSGAARIVDRTDVLPAPSENVRCLRKVRKHILT